MADFKINGKNVITQSGVDEPVVASNVTGGSGLSGSTSLGTVTSGNLSNSAIVYPTGHVIDSGVEMLDGGHVYTNSGSRIAAGNYRQLSGLTVGDTVYFGFSGSYRIYYNIAQTTGRYGELSLYHNTVTCTSGAAATGTSMSASWGGRILHSSSGGIGDADNDSFESFNLSAAFVATATTHHLGLAFKTGHVNARMYMYRTSGNEITFYYNILKGDRVI